MSKEIILAVLLLDLTMTSAVAQQAPPALTLQRVTEMYVQNNLELQAARYRLERSMADRIAARLRPNPGINFVADNLPISGPTSFGRLYETGVTYSETIELGGKRALRERAADQTISVAEAQFEDAMRRGLAEVKRLYYVAVLARYNVEVAAENRQTFEQLVGFNLTRFEEGAIPEVDLIKTRLERMKFESTIRQAELALRQATIRLLTKLGQPPEMTVAPSGNFDLPRTDFDLNALRESALTERADVRAASREVDAANARLQLEHARAKPDVIPYAGYKRVASDNTLLFGVNIPLKIRDRNQAGIARAEADVKTAQVQLEIVRKNALAEVESAYEASQSARQLVETFQDQLLGQAEESRTITLAAYEEGGIELLPVLDAQRTRAEVRQQYFKTLFDYHASLVDLELAVGREIQP